VTLSCQRLGRKGGPKLRHFGPNRRHFGAIDERVTNDKNQDDTGDRMEKNNKLCSEDPAMRDKSASALLPEEATLSEIAAQPEEERRQQGQHCKDDGASSYKPQDDDSEPAPITWL
jgi:hypothetical protein